MNLDPARLPAVLEWNEVIARFLMLCQVGDREGSGACSSQADTNHHLIASLMLCQHELQQLDRPLGSLDRVFQVNGEGEGGGSR